MRVDERYFLLFAVGDLLGLAVGDIIMFSAEVSARMEVGDLIGLSTLSCKSHLRNKV